MALRGGGRNASASRERHRARNILVVAQIALALVLLVSSGLMFRTFAGAAGRQPGFHQAGGAADVPPVDPRLADQGERGGCADAPGDPRQDVGGTRSDLRCARLDRHDVRTRAGTIRSTRATGPIRESQMPPLRLFKFVSPGYMKTLGTSLVAGRDFTWTDIYDLRPVAMVSENLARELWGQPARPSASGSAPTRGHLARSRRRGQRHARRRAQREGRDCRVLAADDGSVPARRLRRQDLRAARCDVRGAQLPHRLGRVRRRAGEAVWSVNANLPLASVRTLRRFTTRRWHGRRSRW